MPTNEFIPDTAPGSPFSSLVPPPWASGPDRTGIVLWQSTMLFENAQGVVSEVRAFPLDLLAGDALSDPASQGIRLADSTPMSEKA